MTEKSSRQVRIVFESVAGIFINRFSRDYPPAALNYSRHQDDVLTLPTGFRSLDMALGIGGLPHGRITELMSPGGNLTSNGATNIAARIASKAQRKQQIVTVIDMNHSFDPWQAERCGFVAPHLLISRPETVLDALITLENVAHKEGLVIITMGFATDLLNHAQPSLLKTLLGRVRNIVRQSDCVYLFSTTAQKNDPFSPTNYPPGFPLSELADVRLWIQDETWSYKDGIATAYKSNLTVIKNTLTIAGKGADIRIKFSDLETFDPAHS